MKRIFTNIFYFGSFLFYLLNSNIQAQDCHAIFSFHQETHSLKVIFNDQSTSHNTINNWLWDFGDGTTSAEQNPSHEYIHEGIYEVCLTIHDAHGCSSTSCHHITVNSPIPPCHALFSFSINNSEVFFTNTSSGTTSDTEYSWDFGDHTNSSDVNAVHIYAQPGTYNVCLTITDPNGCHSTYCHQVTILDNSHTCHASFSFHSDTSGTTIYFSNTSTGTSANTTYLWDFGDGTTSTEENPTHSYSQPGQYIVCLFITDTHTGCTSHYCHSLNIHHAHGHFHLLEGAEKAEPHVKTSGVNKNVANIISFPNPSTNATCLQYILSENSDVIIGVYDYSGNRILLVFDGNENTGLQTHTIDTDKLKSGIYHINISINTEIFSKRIEVIR
jgi:PKD repeat protein